MWSKLTVDMSAAAVKRAPLDEEYLGLGGRSLIAQYMIENVEPDCDPLGDENVLIICGGVFSGTNLTTAHRLSVGAKSPLTGGIKESNAGGYAGTLLAEHGLLLITVHDLPEDEQLYFLHLKADGTAELADADEYRSFGNYAFGEAMRERYGDKIAVMSIGVAGERKYKAATIQITEQSGHPTRVAARGGMGAVMGSKGLKAIVIEKPAEKFAVKYADEEMFRSAALEMNKLIAASAKDDPFHNFGTISTIEETGANGVLPTSNFSGQLSDDYKKVGVPVFMQNLATRGGVNKQPCQPGCVVRCSNVYNGPDGKYLTSGFEYETIALFGPNCRITDLDAIARMDRMCDDLGVDTIDVACAVGVAMECGKINWGDAGAAYGLLEEIAQGTEFGAVMGDGCHAVGEHLGSNRIPTCRKQAMSAYDPRNTKGTGITYATSPQGADHTAGITMGRAFDDCARTAQAYVSNKLQVAMCFCDSMMCLFAFAHTLPKMDLLANMLAGMYGGPVDMTRVTHKMGVTTLLTERFFNEEAGFSAEDNKLPDFFYTEISEATGSVFDINQVEMDTIFDF